MMTTLMMKIKKKQKKRIMKNRATHMSSGKVYKFNNLTNLKMRLSSMSPSTLRSRVDL